MSRLLSPYPTSGGVWLRGNLHAHTTVSDGTMDVIDVIGAYEALGYDFLAISDHDTLVPPTDFQDRTRMTLIPADEVTRGGPHLLAIGIHEVVEPHADRQDVIRDTLAQRAFAVLNHPSWHEDGNHYTDAAMAALTGYTGIEIYNGVIERLEGSALALDRWDRLLSRGRAVWGFASDDSHQERDIGRGWLMVHVQQRSAAEICAAIEAGDFYASTGVTIQSIVATGGAIAVHAPDASRIRLIGEWSRELMCVDGSAATFHTEECEGRYVRVECLGAGGRAAWTQPFTLLGSA